MSTNINPMEATKSTKVVIKADSTEIDEFFVFTDKEKVELSTDGDLVFSGNSKSTKTNESTTDPVINDKAVSKSSDAIPKTITEADYEKKRAEVAKLSEKVRAQRDEVLAKFGLSDSPFNNLKTARERHDAVLQALDAKNKMMEAISANSRQSIIKYEIAEDVVGRWLGIVVMGHAAISGASACNSALAKVLEHFTPSTIEEFMTLKSYMKELEDDE
ncbi:hypothetical protein KCV07_g4025, partial [Aureobasidium melanogenum]